MDKNTMLEAMAHIDQKLIEEADTTISARNHLLKRGMLIAACLGLLVTTALAAGYFFGAPDVEYYENQQHPVVDKVGDSFRPVLNKEDGIPTSTKVPLSSFNEAFLADVSNKPEEEHFLYYYFDAWSDLEDYIGINLWDNPVLDTADCWKLTIEEGDGDMVQSHGYMTCTEMDTILTGVRAKAVYHMNPTEVPSGSAGINNIVPVSVVIESAVYTEHSPIEESEMFSGFFFEAGADFTDELYVSPSGCEFRIIRAEVENGRDGFVSYFGYVCLNNSYIFVKTTFHPDETVALETLKEILDGFVIG